MFLVGVEVVEAPAERPEFALGGLAGILLVSVLTVGKLSDLEDEVYRLQALLYENVGYRA